MIADAPALDYELTPETHRLAGVDPGYELFGVQMPQMDILALQELARQASVYSVNPKFIEIGSWTGRTALAMSYAVPEAMVYAVDHWGGSQHDVTSQVVNKVGAPKVFEAFCKNVGGRLFRSVHPCPGPSLLWAKVWPWKADLIFIDADHDYEAVKADIAAWMPHVRPGGILVGHDLDFFRGVNKAVEELGGCTRLGHSLWFKEC